MDDDCRPFVEYDVGSPRCDDAPGCADNPIRIGFGECLRGPDLCADIAPIIAADIAAGIVPTLRPCVESDLAVGVPTSEAEFQSLTQGCKCCMVGSDYDVEVFAEACLLPEPEPEPEPELPEPELAAPGPAPATSGGALTALIAAHAVAAAVVAMIL
jgi:hypothetical protein